MDKIDIRDLRVGNWLSVHHPTMPAENIQISSDWIRTIERINNGLIKEDSPLFRIVKPIPLTSKILEKNGFKYDEFPKFAVNEISEKTKVSFTYHSGSKTIFVVINESNFNLTSSCVLYVHELQNILRDARIDKEITL